MKTTTNALEVAVPKTSSWEITKGKQPKTHLEKIMKNPKTQLRLASLLSLILLACTAAYGQLTPTGDSYTNTAAATTNYGAKTLLDVESSQTTFIQFNLASIPSGYTSADVTKATLKLYVNAVTTAGSFNVDYVIGTWKESTIDYSNQPALGTTIAASVPLVTADKNQYILVDVTAAVQAWLSGTANDGIALVGNSPVNATFDSKESTSTSHAPELDIVFAGTLTGVTTASGSGLIGGGTSGTLNLSLTNACAANQVLEWNGTAWACANLKGGGTVTSVGSGAGLAGGPITGSGTLSIATGGVTNAMLATSYAQLGAANTFAANQNVTGTITATSSGNSIVGSSAGTANYGVYGINSALTGAAYGVYGTSTSTSGAGVVGSESSPTGSTAGVYGQVSSPAGWGVGGNSPFAGVVGINYGGFDFSTVGAPYGVLGSNASVSVYGASTGISAIGGGVTPHAAGVWGDYGGASGSGFGVLASADDNWAGAFFNNSSTRDTLFGVNAATTGGGSGVAGVSLSSVGYGVAGSSPFIGVEGTSTASPGYGVAGISPYIGVFGAQTGQEISSEGLPYGVVGASPTTIGVYGASYGVSNTGGTLSHSAGVWGDFGSVNGTGVLGTSDDGSGGAFANNSIINATINAENETTTAGSAVFEASMPKLLGIDAVAIIGDAGCGSGYMALQLGQNGMSGCTNYTLMGDLSGNTYLNANSGSFISFRIANGHTQMTITKGNVDVLGTLTKPAGSFKIDHPLDPANKYLYHSFVESPDMKNMYDGTITTDDAGLATVTLPDWFETLNRDFRYQLTVIGQFAQAIVASEISGNQFGIRTDKPNVKVSWQVTGTRQDAFANAHRIQVEVEKAPADRGRYLYPELYGAPETARIGYMPPAPGSEQVVHHQRPTLLRGNDSSARTITLPAPPNPVLPKLAPSRHAARVSHPAQASKPELNQK